MGSLIRNENQNKCDVKKVSEHLVQSRTTFTWRILRRRILKLEKCERKVLTKSAVFGVKTFE